MFTVIKNLAELNEETDEITLKNIKINIGILKLTNIKLDKNQAHHLRGYLGNLFKEYDLVHNHNLQTGKEIYRYPLIQHKIINNTPNIIAINDIAIKIIGEMLIKTKELNIKGLKLTINDKTLENKQYNYGCTEEFFTYEFLNPWVALNQENYKTYSNCNNIQQRNELLKKCLIANIISISKAFNYNVQQEIKVTVNLKQNNIILKGRNLLGFSGYFKTNFELPDYIGLGKSVSRGYGCIKKII